jgi:hypothetical protein
MSATVTKKVLLGNRLFIGSKVEAIGTGVPANGDDLALNLKDYPVGSEYLDTTNKNSYIRFGSAGTAADWQLVGGGGSFSTKVLSAPAVVDSTGGTASGSHTMAAIAVTTPADLAAQATINGIIRNALSTLGAEHNALVAAMKTAGIMVTP